jgi:DNA-binding HxlR family transcriptional regulator
MAEDDVYEAKTEDGIVYVLRVSKTTQGVRTYTVGASVPDRDYSQRAVRRLFEIEKLVAREIEGPRSSSVYSGNSLTAQMRRTMIINRMRQTTDWWTTNEIMAHLDAVKSRSQLVADLSYLAREGLLDYEQGTGRHQQSRYRVTAKGRGK